MLECDQSYKEAFYFVLFCSVCLTCDIRSMNICSECNLAVFTVIFKRQVWMLLVVFGWEGIQLQDEERRPGQSCTSSNRHADKLDETHESIRGCFDMTVTMNPLLSLLSLLLLKIE